MTIGELAKTAGVNVQTIRYYERMKLLPAAHRWPDSGYRDFDEEAELRLRFILSAKDLGFTLREIGDLLDLQIMPGESCIEVKHLLEEKRAEVDRRMTEMRRWRRVLDKLIAACAHRRKKTSCPALWAIMGRAEKPSKGQS
jgi:DNA-binding transcriptional MerR regulator